MFRTSLIPLPIVSALLCATLLSSAFAGKKEPNPWLQINSAHFTVVTDAGEKKGREVALRFEQMRAVFASILNKDHLAQPEPLTILAFTNDDSYYKVAPLHHGRPIDVPGFFLPGDDQNFMVLNLTEAEPWRAGAHDFARMLLDNNYPPAQAWFDEGLADYFSSIQVDDTQVRIGGDPVLTHSGNTNNGTSNAASSAKSFSELLSTQPWISLPDLFATRPNGDDPKAALFEAESWMVMHYLIQEKKLSETGNYLGFVFVQHTPVADAIQKAYGVSAEQLEQAVKDYFHSLPALETPTPGSQAQPYQYSALVKPDDSAIVSKPFPEADARAIYAEVQIRIPERREAGLETLKTLATTPTLADLKAEARNDEAEKRRNRSDADADTLPTTATGNETAHRVLAWDEIEHEQFEQALAELGDAAALDQRDMWIRYYLCALKFRMAQAKKADIAGLANMLIDLRAVLEWYPEMANAYDLLAMARNEGGTTPPAMQAERAAISLSPRNQLYVYHLAQIYMTGKKWDAAQALLQRLKSDSNPQLARLAQESLDEIGNQRKYGMAVANGPQAQLAPQKSPFDVLDQDAAKRASEEQQQEQSDTRPTKFIKGRLIAVDCSSPPVAVLTIATQGVLLKLRAGDYKALLLIGADDFSCSWHDRQITANYKPGGLSDGDLVSLEVR
jgi:tetratricopeptide (TPR) repeat protein